MSIETLKNRLPEYAKDLKLNLSSLASEAALTDASIATFGQPYRAFGEGGSIPFMGMLGDYFPTAQFVVTGALGPGSNAHGPNEFLDLVTARRITACVAMLVHSHGTR